MRKNLLCALGVLALAAGARAWAFDPSPEGSRMEATITAVLESSISADPRDGRYTSGKSKRTLTGTCQLQAGSVQAYGFEGPPANAPQPQAPKALLDLEEEYKKCAGDTACMMRLAEKAAGEDIVVEEPPAEWQIWWPQTCRGSLAVDDSSFTDDPGGEGGGGAFKETATLKGAGSWPEGGEDGWLGVYLETNFVKNTTTVRFAPPTNTIDATRTVVRTGDGAKSETKTVKAVFSTTLQGQAFGPNPGPPQAGAAVRKVDGATLSLEWGVARKPR